MKYLLNISRYHAPGVHRYDTLLEALESACGDILWNSAYPLNITLEDGTEVISREQISEAWPEYAHWVEDEADDDYDPAPWFKWVEWCKEQEPTE